MSKKLIAVAAAAALALTGLVAVPANSAAATLTIAPTAIGGVAAGAQGSVVGLGATSTDAIESAVPSQDVLRSTSTASRSVIALKVTTRSNNAAITVTSTGAVKLLTATQLAAATTTTATGTQSLSLSSNDAGEVIIYAYSTSTSAGTITATEAGATPASNTVFFKGTTSAGNAYKVTVTAPTVAGLGSLVEYTATVVDMFGNAIPSIANLKHTTLGGDASATVPTNNMSYDSVDKVYEGEFTNRTTAGPVALLVALTSSADSIKAFGAKTASVFVNINGTDLQAAITALQAEVAALKADYNALATKWNKRLALKKAPKKAATLK
jgi:hypothetical protein